MLMVPPDLMSSAIVPAITGFVIALILLPLCRVVAFRSGIVSHPRNDRWHRQTVPLLGGVGIALPMLAGAVITGAAAQMAVPLIAAFLVFIVGLVDDVLALKPATKLIAQIALASLLVYFGFSLSWVESRLMNSVLTIVWVVGLTNAFNLLDNMDGLCGGIAFVVAAMLLAGLLGGATRDQAGAQIAVLALLLGSTGAFLIFNFPPASVFMGDCGALFLGFALASLTLSPEGIRGSRTDVAAVIAGPVFVLLIPIFDTALVTVSRLLSGRSPAVGGRDHSSHRLVAIGLSERAAVMVLWSLAGVGGIIGLGLRSATDSVSLLVGAGFLSMMGLFAVFLTRVHVYDDQVKRDAITPLLADFMYKRRVVEVVFDSCAIALAYYGAYRLRFTDPGQYLANAESFYDSLPVMLAAQLIAFFVVGVYRGTWHYFNWRDGVALLKGAALGTAATQLALLYVYGASNHPRAVFLIYFALVLAITIIARVSFRGIVALARHERLMRRVVIYGAGEHAALAVQELQQDRGRIKVLGFVDDDPDAAATRLEGYTVLGDFDALTQLIASHAVDVVVLNREQIDDDRLSALETSCEDHDVTLLRLHVGIEELVSHHGASRAARLRAQLRKSR
jgi:UDP-GlcNAc:undecaprenyl-phosphate GlcNAc-1-phosphate transferase